MTRRHRKNPPTLWLMTDERVDDAAMLAAAARLPRRKGGIVFRHYRTDPVARRELFERLRAIAQARGLVLMLAGTARQAAAWRADGWHGRKGRPGAAPLWHSAPAHDVREIVAAHRARVDILFLSPLFPTRSHPGSSALGRVRFAALARQAHGPVIALGGVRLEHRRLLAGIGADGWAAIDGLTDR